MSTKKCSFIVYVAYFLLQTSGLLPSSYKNGKFQGTYFHKIYSISVVLILSIGFIVCSRIIYFDNQQSWINNNSYFILNAYFKLHLLIFCVTYGVQYYNLTLFQNQILKLKNVLSQEFIELKSCSRSQIECCLLLFFKIFIVDGLNLGIHFYLSQATVPNQMEYKIMGTICILPSVILRILPNFFYGILLLIYFSYEKINVQLREIMAEANDLLNDEVDNVSDYCKMQRFCELSEFVDRLSIAHRELTEIVNCFSRMQSFNILFWISHTIVSSVMQFFIEFCMIISLYRYAEIKFPSSMMFWNFFLAIAILLDFILFARICNDVKQKANSVIEVIHSNFQLHKADVRFKRSVGIIIKFKTKN